MSAQEPVSRAAQLALEGLVDITPPPPVSWLPQTWRWVALGILLAVALIASGWRRHQRALANRYRIEALRELSALEPLMQHPQTRDAALLRVAALIKRTALAAYPRGQVAPLSGPSWVQYTRDRGLEVEPVVTTLLDDLEYQSTASRAAISGDVATGLLRATRTWIKGHRVPS
jgi:uncharacterized protein DUF4381